MHCSKCSKLISKLVSLTNNIGRSCKATTPSHCHQSALTGSTRVDFRRTPFDNAVVHAHLRNEPTQDSGRRTHITPFSASQQPKPYPKEICGSNSRSLTASSYLVTNEKCHQSVQNMPFTMLLPIVAPAPKIAALPIFLPNFLPCSSSREGFRLGSDDEPDVCCVMAKGMLP